MKHAGTFSKNHLDLDLNLGIGTCRNGAPTSNIVIARVKSRPTHMPITTGLPEALPTGDSRSVPRRITDVAKFLLPI
jgi:hypothetical protein